MLSSTVGIIVGDWTWLEGLRILGARDIIIMDTFKPFVAALMGNWFLGEQLNPTAYVGLILTIGGVTIVGLEKEVKSDDNLCPSDEPQKHDAAPTVPAISNECVNLLPQPQTNAQEDDKGQATLHEHQKSYAEQRRNRMQTRKTYLYGLSNGLLNILLHALGSTITKLFGRGMSTSDINLVRFGFAGFVMGLLSSSMSVWTRFLGPNRRTFAASPWAMPSMPTSSWIHVCVGVMFVTFLHPALVNYAMFQIPLALLLTLDSIGPLYSLPLGWLIQKERPTIKACFGAFLSVGGIVILAFKGMAEAHEAQRASW